MLNKIFWKGFRKNRKNFVLLACTGSLVTAVSFAFMAFNDMLLRVITEKDIGTAVMYAMSASISIMEVLLQILLILAAVCYMRTRASEYGMLNIMGIKKKHRKKFMLKEYSVLIACSVCGGVLLGFAATELIKQFLVNLYPARTAELVITWKVVISSIANGIGLFVGLFMVCDELIYLFGIDALLNLNNKSGKRPKCRPLLALLGFVFIIAALVIMQSYWGRVNKFTVTVLCLIGIYSLYVSLGGILLFTLRKRENRYYKKIHWLNTWYHRFYQNINMMCLITVLLFVAVFLFALPLLDTFPLDTSDNYPYDVVWMANEEDNEFLTELDENYEIDIKKVPCIRVTSADQTEHMAIAESEYEAWTNETISLKDNEILVNYQREIGDRNKLPVDYGAGDTRIAAGCNRAELWIYAPTGDVIPSKEFDTEYQEKETRNHILTGIFGTGMSEHIIVFSDSSFEKLKKEALGANLAVVMQIPNQYEEILTDIYEYAAIHSQRDYYTGANLIYAKKEMVEGTKAGRLLSRNIGGINFILILLCTVFITIIKTENDSQEMIDKYGFYFQMGMPFHVRKKGIQKECRLTVLLPAILGIVLGIVFVLRELFLRKLNSIWIIKYLVGILGVCLLIVIIYGIIAIITEHKMIKKATKKEAE